MTSIRWSAHGMALLAFVSTVAALVLDSVYLGWAGGLITAMAVVFYVLHSEAQKRMSAS